MTDAKRNWKENQMLASLVLIAAVLISVFGIGGIKVKSVGAKANAAFDAMIAGEITARISAAENIVAAVKYADAADAKAAIAAVKAARTPSEIYAANTALNAKIDALYEFEHAQASVEVGGALQTQLSEFRSRGERISIAAETYNKLAHSEREKISGFPGELLARMTGSTVELFGA